MVHKLTLTTILILFAAQLNAQVAEQLAGHAPGGLKSHVPPNFFIGGALHGDHESFQNAAYREVARQNFNAVTATIYMPWNGWLNPKHPPSFSAFENVADWASRNGIRTHGHALLYPDANSKSDWWNQLANNSVETTLFAYVDSLARTQSGKVWTWDVVNEVMADDDEPMDQDGLRTKYKEYQAMGPEYVDKVFRWASKADANSRLIINTTGCESFNNKSTRLYHYVMKLRARGVPVHGVGFQMHFLDLNAPHPDVKSIASNFQRFADAGFEIYITEMDACSIQTFTPSPHQPGMTTPNQQQLTRQSRYYEQILRLALAQPACKAFLMWDYADDYSWLHKTDRQIYTLPKGAYTYPAPFWCGKHCPISPKPAYHGMLNVLKTTPKIHR